MVGGPVDRLVIEQDAGEVAPPGGGPESYLSAPPDASRNSFGWNSTVVTPPVCSLRSVSSFPAVRSHNWRGGRGKRERVVRAVRSHNRRGRGGRGKGLLEPSGPTTGGGEEGRGKGLLEPSGPTTGGGEEGRGKGLLEPSGPTTGGGRGKREEGKGC